MTSVGSFCTYRLEELILPSAGARPGWELTLDCDPDDDALFRCEESIGARADSERYFEKMVSAARIVGSSRFAGVPVFDRDRRVDFPKAPLSGACFLVLVAPEWESELLWSIKISDIILAQKLTQERPWHMVFELHHLQCTARRLERCGELVAAWR